MLPRVFQKNAHHTRALNNVNSVLMIFTDMRTCPFLPVWFQKKIMSEMAFFIFSVFSLSSEH